MVFLVPLFCGLGIWQLDRAEQKRQMAASLEARRKLPTLALNHESPEPSKREYRKIEAYGRFLPQKTVLIENRKHLGQRGFHVITPFRLDGSGEIVLVNRGWIPHTRLDRAEPLPTPTDSRPLTGVITLPEHPALELEFTADANVETPRWPYLTLDHFSRWSELEILPFAILQSPEDEGGFVRDWPQPQISDAMHIGYAIQWFAFAVIAMVIWLRLSLPKTEVEELSP
jgi:surfeit locus 1 family protein